MSYLDHRRKEMIKLLMSRGINDPLVIRAMEKVPRHSFVPQPLAMDSYRDGPLPIGQNQTISQPYIVALMTQALKISPEKKALEIGTGSGYQAAVLAEMGVKVFTIERHKELWQKASSLLKELGYSNVVTRHGDGTVGWSSIAPFDGILVTAGGPEIPLGLVNQLRIGGRMIVPAGGRNEQILYSVVRTGDNCHDIEELGSVGFVPLIGKDGWKQQQN